MTTTLGRIITMTAAVSALVAAHGPALGQTTMAETDPDLARLVSPSADDYVSAGVGYWSNDRAFQGQYDGMQDEGTYLLFDSHIRRRNDATGTWFSLDARNVGLDTRDVRLGIERQGDVGGYFEYDQIPRKNPWTINTNLLGIGQSNMTITGGAPLSSEVHLGTRRDRTSLGFFKNLDSLLPGLEFKIDYRTEEKNGQLPYGLGSQPLFLVQPIDSTIQLLDAHFAYSKDKLQMRGGYYGTWYDTSINQLFGLRSAAGQPGSTFNPNPTPLSQPLSNQSWEAYIDGGYSITPTTRLMWKAKYGQATQNDQIPSWDLPAPNDRFVLMPQNLGGKIKTTLYQASISSRPVSKLLLTGNLRYYDMHDETPLLGVVGNNATGAVTVHNTPQSIRTKSGKVEAAYSLPMGFKVIGTIDGKDQDRSTPLFQNEIYVPYRSNLTEWNYGVQLRRGLSETINGSIGYVYSKRTGDGYTLTEASQSDMINPMHIADRNREKWRLKLDWTPLNNFALAGTADYARDQYPWDPGRPFGLTKGKAQFYAIDATYQINPDWQLVGWYAHDKTDADQYAARWAGAVLEGYKSAQLQDKNDSLGLSLKGKVDAKWKVGADVLYTKARASYDESWDPTGAGNPARYPGAPTQGQLPDIKTELARFGVYADYAVQKNGSLRLDVIYEHWKTNDWSYTFANGDAFTYGTTGATADGTTFTQSSPQNATFVGLRYKYMLD
jgi:MtrB/PioB family decaheme-associated outer membrane protein